MTSIFITLSKKKHWYNYNDVMFSIAIIKVIKSAKLFKTYSFDFEIIDICYLILKLLNPQLSNVKMQSRLLKRKCHFSKIMSKFVDPFKH